MSRPQLQAGGVNVGKALAHEIDRLVRDVKQNIIRPAFLHLVVNGPRHDVPRRQRLARMILLHEGRAGEVLQNGPLPAHRFADEKGFGLAMIKAGRMKLDELHVADARPRPIGHGHAVAGGDVGIGRVKIDLAAPAGGQQHGAGGEGLDVVAIFVQDVGAQAAVGRALVARQLAGGNEINGDMILKHLDVGMFGHGGQQGAFDLAARHILGVEDAPFGVPAFAAQIQFAQRR